MAKAKKPERKKAPEGRATMWSDLDRESQQAANHSIRQMGMAKSRVEGAKEAARMAGERSDNPFYAQKQSQRVQKLTDIQPELRDKPMTQQGATRRRVSLVEDAKNRAVDEGESSIGGAGWYFGHHAEIMKHGSKHGFSPDEAIAATTALSPQNDPRTERKAGGALMDMVANQQHHTVTMTPQLHAAVNKTKLAKKHGPLGDEHLGKQVSLSQLSSHHIAAIGSLHAQMEKAGTPVQSTADFQSLGATRLSDEIHTSAKVLRGEMHHSEAINPHTAPKVWNYNQNTRRASPNSPEHVEYMSRMQHALHGDPKQGMFDLYGLRRVRGDHILSSKGPTVEDSWQHAISTGQKLQSEARGATGRTYSPAKIAASDPNIAEPQKTFKKASQGKEGPKVTPDPRLTGSGVVHAWNTEATQRAANKMPIQMGHETAEFPSMAVQEIGWTEARIQADKDPEYNARQRARQAERHGSPQQFKGQQSLF